MVKIRVIREFAIWRQMDVMLQSHHEKKVDIFGALETLWSLLLFYRGNRDKIVQRLHLFPPMHVANSKHPSIRKWARQCC